MDEAILITYTFIFNMAVSIIFATIYYIIPDDNFEPSVARPDRPRQPFLDYFFYSITIQSGIGLPGTIAVSDLAKVLVTIQQILLMGSTYFLLITILKKK